MKKSFTPYLLLLFLFSAVLQAQVWEPVGTAAGISTGTAGKLTLTRDTQDNLWVGYYDVAAAKGSVQKWESTTASALGKSGVFKNDNTGGEWTYTSDGSEFVYQLKGLCESTLATSDAAAQKMTYFPNPVTDELNINAEENITDIRVFNMAGQQVLSQTAKTKTIQVKLGSLPAGLYIVNATFANGQTKALKIIKK